MQNKDLCHAKHNIDIVFQIYPNENNTHFSPHSFISTENQSLYFTGVEKALGGKF